MKYELEKVNDYGKGVPALWLVKVGGKIVGMLERFRTTKAEVHPWKAFKGHSYTAKYLGAFYEDGSVPDDGDTTYGGKKAAIEAILAA